MLFGETYVFPLDNGADMRYPVIEKNFYFPMYKSVFL